MPEDASTRTRFWRAIEERYRTDNERLAAWRNTDVIAATPDAEWATAHLGVCALCSAATARLYPGGWRCDRCKPGRGDDRA